jgi:cytoskeletal protein CcmA (bactofilin family)
MASTYTDIGTELMTTGENAGNWGTKTNVNLQILEEAVRGYVAISANSDQTLSLTDGSTGDSIRNAVIAFTGTLSANRTITVPAVEKWWIMDNQTAGAYTLTVKVSGQTGITWGASDKGTKILYGNGTDVVDTNVGGGVGAYDLNGNELTLDADADTSITASTDDQIDFEIAGADDFTMTANAFNVLTGSHVTFADSANAKFGTGNDMLMYHDGSNSYITNAVGALKIATETSGIAVTIGHTTSEVTVADNLTVTGTLTGTLETAAQGNVTSLGTLTTLTVDNIITNGTTIGHTSDTDLLTLTSGVLTVAGELDATTLDISGNADIDGTTNLDAVDIDGAVQVDATITVGADDQGYDVKFFGDTASAYMMWDTSADDLVLAGAAGIDLAGDIDVDGTANLDAVDIDGAVQIDNTVTVGVDDTGYDVKFFGDTASAYMLWDTSADDLILGGAAGLIVPDGQFTLGSTAVTTTAAEINLIDGGTSRGTTAVADGDGLLVNDGGTMRMTNVTTLKTYFQTGVTASSIAADDISTGDGAVTIATSSGNITIDAQAGDTDIIFKGTDSSTDTTALTLDMSDAGTAIFNNDISLDSDSCVLKFGDDQDTTLTHTDGTGLTLNSTNKLCFQDTGTYIGSNADGDLDVVSDGTAVDSINIESAGGITLDAGTAASGIIYEDDGTEMLRIHNSSSDVIIEAKVQDKDIIFKGDDGGSGVTALTLDMSAGGIATFGAAANVAQQAITSSSNAIAWDASDKPNAYHQTTENTTLSAPTNAVEGAFICIEINFNGSHTFAWNAIFNFAADTAPTTTDTDGKTDIFVFRYNGAIWQEVGRTLNIPES